MANTPPPSDKNTYALSISLQLDTDKAFKGLDDFGKKLITLEEDVATAAQKAISQLSSISTEALDSLTDIGKVLKEIDATSLKVETNFTKATKELDDQFKTDEDYFKNLKSELKLETKEFKLHKDIGKELQTRFDLVEEHLKIAGKIVEAEKRINNEVRIQNGLLATGVDAVGAMNAELGKSTGKQDAYNKKLGESTISWRTIWGWIKESDKATELFTTTNFRALGSQQELVSSARNLAITYGLMADKTLEATAILGNLKVPKEELTKYTKIVVMAGRTTGVAAQGLATYVNQLRVAGATLPQIERHLAFATEAMRKFGLSSADTSVILSGTAADINEITLMMGGTAEGVIAFKEAQAATAGFGKTVGVTAEQTKGFYDSLVKDKIALSMYAAYAGHAANGAENFRIATMKAALQAAKDNQAFIAQSKLGADEATAARIAKENLIKVYYKGNEAQFLADAAMGETMLATKNAGETTADWNKLLKINANTLEGQYAESMEAFTAQLDLAKSSFKTLGMQVMVLVADALVPLLKATNTIVSGIGEAYTAVSKFIAKLKAIPGLGPVISFLIGFAKYYLVVTLVVGMGVIAIMQFLKVLSAAPGVVDAVTRTFVTMAEGMLAVAKAVGGSIEVLLTSLGRGLFALGNAVKGVLLPLIVVGMVFILVAAGAWLFAQAIVVLAKAGDGVIPLIIALTIAIVVIAIAIGILGSVAEAAAPGFIILAVVILSLGLAAIMMGFGVKMAAEGIQILSTSLTLGLIGSMYLLSGAIIAVGAAGLLAGPGLLAASIGLVAVAGALMLAALALEKMGISFQVIVAGKFIDFATDIAAGAAILLPAAIAVGVAGVALAAGAVFLLAGMVLLQPAAELALSAGTMIGVGGPLILTGVTAITSAAKLMPELGFDFIAGAVKLGIAMAAMVAAGKVMVTAGTLVSIGGALFHTGAESLVVGLTQLSGLGPIITAATAALAGVGPLAEAVAPLTPLGAALVAAGTELIIGGMLLVMGMQWVTRGADLTVVAGTALGVGGKALLTGIKDVLAAGDLLSQIGFGFVLGAFKLGVALAALAPVAATAGIVGAAMALGGEALLLGLVYIVLAGALFQLTADALAGAGALFQTAVAIVLKGATDLGSAGEMLALAAVKLTEGAAAFGPASAQLFTIATTLLTGSVVLFFAGRLLVPAAFAIYTGMLWLQFSLDKFAQTIDRVDMISKAVALLAASFLLLQRTPLGGLRELADSALQALPAIENLGTGLATAAQKLHTGVEQFQGPVNELGVLVTQFDKYATLLENASERMNLAVAKALPAIRAGEGTSVDQTVRAEAIYTVKVLNTKEGESDTEERGLEIASNTYDTLVAIEGHLKEMQNGGKGELTEIIGLLKTYLPGNNKGDTGLGSEMNAWSK